MPALKKAGHKQELLVPDTTDTRFPMMLKLGGREPGLLENSPWPSVELARPR